MLVPVTGPGFQDSPFTNRRTHCTVAYKLAFHGGDAWKAFWAMKNRMQGLLFPRVVGMMLDPRPSGHTFALHPDSELWYVLDSLREVIHTTAGIQELVPFPMPYHAAWKDL